MKYVLLALIALSTASAQAAPLFCSTNVQNDSRKGATTVTINSLSRDRAAIEMSTNGGMAHFVTAPAKFDAFVKNVGPEVVIYSNAEQNFELTVVAQPMMGKIRGTLKAVIMGQKSEVPVVCVAAFNAR